MSRTTVPRHLARLSFIALVAVAVAAGALAAPALAGECPAGMAAPNALADAPTMPVGVTDTELASVDLAHENVHLDGRRLRLRHMTIAPGGIVPLHSHEDRPALIKIDSGEIYENNSRCTVPILHEAGDIAREFLGTRHWWKNTGRQPVELTIADIVNDRMPATMMEMM